MRFKVSLPAASIGAKCFSVVSLHANGREDSLAAKTWLICGSVHPPLFALSSFLQMPIPFTNRCKYAAICEIVSALSGFCIIRLPVNCSYNSHYEKLDGVERCIDDELLFEIPDSWEWVRLGTVLEIARGGSPRPIQQYLTTEPDGINWIKIGDTDKGGKYIYKTKEKIRPEGVAKSRMVHSGDFLLTNSMSFGRPYILKSDGCIHDGWLVLSNRFECYSVDFLYYILSSPFAYYQFCDSVSGAVVKNLNSDKVANALFPLPPLSEQKRIVQRIEELLPLVKGL